MNPESRFGVIITLGLDRLLGEPERPDTLWAGIGSRGRGLVRILVALTQLTVFAALVAVAQEYGALSYLKGFAFLFLNAGGTLLLLTGLIQLLSGKAWTAFSRPVRLGLVLVLTPLVGAPIFFVTVSSDVLLERLETSEWYKSMDEDYAVLYQQAEKTREALRSCRDHPIPIRCECETLPELGQEIDALRKITAAKPELERREMTFPLLSRPNVREVVTAERLYEYYEMRMELCETRGS